MQRYSGGLAVPLDMLDVFSGADAITNSVSEITVALTYTPKSLAHIVIPPILNVAMTEIRYSMLLELTGNLLRFGVVREYYLRADTVTFTTDAAGGGAVAEPHEHEIDYNVANVEIIGVPNEQQKDIAVHYTVA